jgi:hypothetical protein
MFHQCWILSGRFSLPKTIIIKYSFICRLYMYTFKFGKLLCDGVYIYHLIPFQVWNFPTSICCVGTWGLFAHQVYTSFFMNLAEKVLSGVIICHNAWTSRRSSTTNPTIWASLFQVKFDFTMAMCGVTNPLLNISLCCDRKYCSRD